MEERLQKLERWVHLSIPYCLIILLFVIIAEIFFSEWAHHHEVWVKGADYIVVAIFLVDLYFKWIRKKSWPHFFKTSWLDIIAVFPFFLFFRLIQQVSAAVRTGELIQTSLHEVVELEKASKVLKETGKGERMLKVAKELRFVRLLARIPRFAKAAEFFRHPTPEYTAFPQKKSKKR